MVDETKSDFHVSFMQVYLLLKFREISRKTLEEAFPPNVCSKVFRNFQNSYSNINISFSQHQCNERNKHNYKIYVKYEIYVTFVWHINKWQYHEFFWSQDTFWPANRKSKHRGYRKFLNKFCVGGIKKFKLKIHTLVTQ